MKFNYDYRTRENERRRGTITAASREDVFSKLRAQGIRPSSVEEAPGFFNKLFGKHKRMLAIVFLLALVLALARNLMREKARVPRAVGAEDVVYARADGSALACERRQIWGDEAVIEQAMHTQWKRVFMNPAERLLALFAQPGLVQSVFPTIPETIHADFRAALQSRVKVEADDLDEWKQMKCLVAGMKEEMRAYLSAGGTIDGYLKRLVMRQREEADVWESAKKELERRIEQGEDDFAAWNEINRFLREQGLKSIPLPTP